MQNQFVFIDYEKKYIRSKASCQKVRIKGLLAFIIIIFLKKIKKLAADRLDVQIKQTKVLIQWY